VFGFQTKLELTGGSLKRLTPEKRMSFTQDENDRWEDNVIIYTFDDVSTLSDVEKTNVLLAQDYIAENSCVSFAKYYDGIHADLGLHHRTYLSYGKYSGFVN
jgi:hypothetical protein